MNAIKQTVSLQRLSEYDLQVCFLFNYPVRRPLVKRFFQVISRLGDGMFWYLLLVLFPLFDDMPGLGVTLHMLAVGLVSTLLYKGLKQYSARERPYVTHTIIELGADPLDRFSFPSGHTLHAVGFTAVVLFYYPVLAWLLLPFTLLVMASRMVLGLHYPSDVLMGMVIGLTVAVSSFEFLPDAIEQLFTLL
ncbi:MAG: phosphatase PAP2 family protein [Chromatiales bacterium]|nr:phosphatase PAP2 family protein [Chromatiales bacterium]